MGSDTWDHSWEMEQDKCGDSQKLLHRAKDSAMASLARLNTSSPHRGTSCFTSPSRAARNRPKNTLTASARRYYVLWCHQTFVSLSESRTPFPLLLHQFAWILMVVKQHCKPWSYTSDISYCHCPPSSSTAPGKHKVSSHPGQGAAEPRIPVFKPVGKAQMKHLCSLLAVVGSAFSSANSWCLLNRCCCCWQVK